MKKAHRLLLVIVLLNLLLAALPPQAAQAQLDVMHYIPPVFATYTSRLDARLYLSTPSTDDVNVTVEDGAGVVVWSGSVSNSAPTYTDAVPTVLTLDTQLNQVQTNGLIVRADAPVYANIRYTASNQAASLTAKGLAALGTRFRAGVMRDQTTTSSSRGLFVAVMATEDDTAVHFDEIKPGVVFYGTPTSGSPLTTDPISVTLNAGQSYVVGIRASNYASSGGTAPFNDVNGTLITSDRPIAVSSGTWRGGPSELGLQDIGLDQTVPETRLALEYILMKGNGADTDMETPIVVATADHTRVFVNGSGTPFATLQTGEYLFLDGQYSTNGNMLVEATQPIYVYQTLGGSTNLATPGMSFIPPIDATISSSVNNIPDVNHLGDATVNILALSGAWVKINGAPIGVAADPVLGTSDWVTYRVTGLVGDIKVESEHAVAVQFVNVSVSVGAAGYYAGLPLVYRDFGDLPADYSLTTLEDNGARHVSSALLLGGTIDGEQDGQESADAGLAGLDGDDGADIDDEDGVTVPGGWAEGTNGGSVEVSVTGGAGCLSAWLDWNDNNSFGDAGDQLLDMVQVVSGTNPIRFDVPVSALTIPGTYNRFARFRLGPDSGTPNDCSDDIPPSLTGLVAGGEVEDHLLTFILTRAPIAAAGNDQIVLIDWVVNLDGSGSSDPDNDVPLAYGWKQTSGKPVSLDDSAAAQPAFTAPGTPAVLTFRLIVTDALGAPDLTPDEVRVIVTDNFAPVADAGGPYSGDEGVPVNLDGSGSGDLDGVITLYEWDCTDDGTFDVSSSNPDDSACTYLDDGSYTLRLRVTDDGGETDEDTAPVTISDQGPTADFSWVPEPQDEGASIIFTDQSTSYPDDIVAWDWDFGGLGSSSLQNASFTFMDDGLYAVTLTVTDDDGSTNTSSYTVTISDLAPTADFTWSPEPQDEGYAVSFTDLSTSFLDDIIAWSWDYGGLGSSSAQNPTFTFLDNGPYTVTLTATDDDGSSDTISQTITVTDLGPTAGFSWSPEPQEEGFAVSFTDLSASFPDAIVAWSWDFGGLGSSSTQNPSFTFVDDGLYTVTLTVSDDDGSIDTVSHTVTVTDLGPAADFSWSPDPQDEGFPVSFTDLSTSFPDDIVAWSWDFDGLGSSTAQNPSFTFLNDGSYSVALTVTDADGSIDTVGFVVTILDLELTADFTWTPAHQDEGAAVSFTDQSMSFPDDIVAWSWDFGGLGSSTAQDPSFTFTDDGSYVVALTVTDEDDSSDSVSYPVTIDNAAPTLSLSGESSVNEGSSYTLGLSALTEPGDDTLADCTIDWGDGTSADCLSAIDGSVAHTYVDGPNSYTIMVDLADEDGAYEDVDSHNLAIIDVRPAVTLTGPDSIEEGWLYTLDLSAVTDPGVDTVSGCTLDWGDGGTGSCLSAIDGSMSHIYGDGADSHIISVDLTDEDGVHESVDSLAVDVYNVAPIADDDNYTTHEDVPLIRPAPGVLANDYDVPADTLTAVLDSRPATGTLDFRGDGSFIFTPTLRFSGIVTFSYAVSDGMFDATAQVSVTVSADAPAADADAYTTDEDMPLVVSAPGVLENDSDPNADPLTALLESGPAHGSLELNVDGSFTFTPSLDYNGTDSFVYRATDGAYTSNPTTVDLDVTAVNDAPTADDDAYSTFRNKELAIAAPGVLDGDTDADGNTLTAIHDSNPAVGTLVFHSDGSFVYTPPTGYIGTVTFGYHAIDGAAPNPASSRNATVTIEVKQPPVTNVYIPLVTRNRVKATGLIVESSISNRNEAQAVISNRGNAPTSNEF